MRPSQNPLTQFFIRRFDHQHDESHNWFLNYATWRVYQSIAEEDAIYRHWIAKAAAVTDVGECEGWSPTDLAANPCFKLSSELRSAFYSGPLFAEFGVYTDLLFAALGKVEWREVALMLMGEAEAGVSQSRTHCDSASAHNPAIRFTAGSIHASPQVLSELWPKHLIDAVNRHQRGDWGEVSPAEREFNDDALFEGLRVSSIHVVPGNITVEISTDEDRMRTEVTMLSEQN